MQIINHFLKKGKDIKIQFRRKKKKNKDKDAHFNKHVNIQICFGLIPSLTQDKVHIIQERHIRETTTYLTRFLKSFSLKTRKF